LRTQLEVFLLGVDTDVEFKFCALRPSSRGVNLDLKDSVDGGTLADFGSTASRRATATPPGGDRAKGC